MEVPAGGFGGTWKSRVLGGKEGGTGTRTCLPEPGDSPGQQLSERLPAPVSHCGAFTLKPNDVHAGNLFPGQPVVALAGLGRVRPGPEGRRRQAGVGG